MFPDQISVRATVLTSAELSRGVPVDADGFEIPTGWVPPYQEKLGKLTLAFLGLLFDDPIVADLLRGIVALYPHDVHSGDDAIVSHQLSWDFWEKNPGQWSADVPFKAPLDYYDFKPVNGVYIYSLPIDYREAILHLCSRERLGRSYPRLIHAAIVTYILTLKDDAGPVFEAFVVPNAIAIEENSLSGYYHSYEVRFGSGLNSVRIGTPDERKRNALKRLQDPVVRDSLSSGWDAVREQRKEAIGYSRRRKISESSIEHISWLFARHILGEPHSCIASQAGTAISTVELAIKNLRHIMDLQAKGAVRCLTHKVRPGRLHTR